MAVDMDEPTIPVSARAEQAAEEDAAVPADDEREGAGLQRASDCISQKAAVATNLRAIANRGAGLALEGVHRTMKGQRGA